MRLLRQLNDILGALAFKVLVGGKPGIDLRRWEPRFHAGVDECHLGVAERLGTACASNGSSTLRHSVEIISF